MKINRKLKSKWPWGNVWRWTERTKAIAEIIPPEARILELGGGFCYLHKLKPDNEYQSIDIEKWTDLTTVANFNKNEFPEIGLWDVLVCQGIIEYMDDPKNFLEQIKKYGRRMIMSYWRGENKIEGQKNEMTFEEFEEMVDSAGWWIASQRHLTADERLYYCTKK